MVINEESFLTIQSRQWLWFNWYGGCFQQQRSAAVFYQLYQKFVEKTKITKKRPGIVHLKNNSIPKFDNGNVVTRSDLQLRVCGFKSK